MFIKKYKGLGGWVPGLGKGLLAALGVCHQALSSQAAPVSWVGAWVPRTFRSTYSEDVLLRRLLSSI